MAQKEKLTLEKQEKFLRELISKAMIEIKNWSITIAKQDSHIVNITKVEKIEIMEN